MTKQKTTNGKEIEIKRTANTDMTPEAYSVYAGGKLIAGNKTATEARKIADGLTRPLAEHVKTEMERSW